MQQLVHCISLKVVRYNDTSAIVTAWSRECGRLSLSVPWGASREARRRRALMMPFSLFEGIANIRPGREISTVSDVRAIAPWNSGDPLQGTISLFLADVLSVVLRENQGDAHIADFIFGTVPLMGALRGAALANYHLYFLYHLGVLLGIAPDTGTYHRGRYFDMREGIFTDVMPTHHRWLDAQGARMVWLLSRLTPRSLSLLRLSRNERRQTLNLILQYYDMHLAALSSLSSLQMLHTIFD